MKFSKVTITSTINASQDTFIIRLTVSQFFPFAINLFHIANEKQISWTLSHLTALLKATLSYSDPTSSRTRWIWPRFTPLRLTLTTVEITVSWSSVNSNKGKRKSCPYPRHKDMWGSRGIASLMLILGTLWRWLVNFTPYPLCPRERIQWICGWMSLRAGLDVWKSEKYPAPVGIRIPSQKFCNSTSWCILRWDTIALSELALQLLADSFNHASLRAVGTYVAPNGCQNGQISPVHLQRAISSWDLFVAMTGVFHVHEDPRKIFMNIKDTHQWDE